MASIGGWRYVGNQKMGRVMACSHCATCEDYRTEKVTWDGGPWEIVHHCRGEGGTAAQEMMNGRSPGGACAQYVPKGGGAATSGGSRSYDDDDSGEAQESGPTCSYCGKTISGEYGRATVWMRDRFQGAEQRTAIVYLDEQGSVFCSAICAENAIREAMPQALRKRKEALAAEEQKRQQGFAAAAARAGVPLDVNDIFFTPNHPRFAYMHRSEVEQEVAPLYDAFVKAGVPLASFAETLEQPAYNYDAERGKDSPYFWDGGSEWYLHVDGNGAYKKKDAAILKDRMVKRARFAAPDEKLPDNVRWDDTIGIYYNHDELQAIGQKKWGPETYLNGWNTDRKAWRFASNHATAPKNMFFKICYALLCKIALFRNIQDAANTHYLKPNKAGSAFTPNKNKYYRRQWNKGIALPLPAFIRYRLPTITKKHILIAVAIVILALYLWQHGGF